MEIKIKKMGIAQGTVGWLSKGLESGTLTIIEGTLKKTGSHGLWLKGTEGFSQFLAAFNQYGLDARDGNFQKYDTADDNQDRLGVWTDAAWKTLMKISKAWCDECNAIIELEQPVEIKLIRVETNA